MYAGNASINQGTNTKTCNLVTVSSTLGKYFVTYSVGLVLVRETTYMVSSFLWVLYFARLSLQMIAVVLRLHETV